MLWRNHFKNFQLRFEIPEARRPGEMKYILDCQIIQIRYQLSDHPKNISRVRSVQSESGSSNLEHQFEI
jgi:hypothetical protein